MADRETLALPLEVAKTGVPDIRDADNNLIVTVWPNPTGKGALERARSRAEVIKAALERDAGKSFSPAVNRAMARFYTHLADYQESKPPHVPRCNEIVKGYLCQLAEDHEGECGPLFREEHAPACPNEEK